MRFDRIRIGAFGPLAEMDTGPNPLPPLVVVQAPNEGGKSSFFVALSTLLYGFYPAGRDRHPYAPWSGADAELEARIERNDGSALVVHRRLLSSPWGRVTRHVAAGDGAGAGGEGFGDLGGSRDAGGEVSDIANRTLSFVGHVRRELFDDVFALTLGDLARVDDESWEEIQDRLLGAMGAEDLRGSRAVVQELEDEGDSLWRSDRRGKPEARELQRRLEELDGERRDARERDREARETARKLDELRGHLQRTKEERLAAEAVVERAQTLGPVRSQILRIGEAEERAGDPGELTDLPPRPAERITELEEAARERQEQITGLRERVAALEERAESVTETDRRILERARDVRELGKRAGEVQAARRRLPALEEREASLARRCREVAGQLFSRPWDDVDGDRIRDLPLGELRSRLRGFRDAREHASALDARLDAVEEEEGAHHGGGRRSTLPVLPLLTTLAAAALLGWGLLTDRLVVAAGAVLLLLPGLLWSATRIAESVLRRREAERRSREAGSIRQRLREARNEEEGARERVAGVLHGLPIIEDLLESPDLEIAHLLGELQSHLEATAENRRDRERQSRLMEEADARLRETAEAVGLDLPEGFLAGVVALEARLEEAGNREADARAARESLDDSRSALERLRDVEERESERLRQLRRRLEKLGGGDLERGAEVAAERLQARERARTFREDLERRHPDLDDLRRRIREAEQDGEAWTTDEEASVRAREQAKELNEREKELISEIGDREARLREIEGRTTLDRIEGEILQVQEELDGVRRRRDRLALLAGIVRAADECFRERNQPDLLRTAGEYLETITGGRYRRLLMEEGGLGGTLYLDGPGYPHPVEVDTPVSTGTREQVYLALRLAVIDHLDAGSDRLPVFLDEAFVNWDAERRERAFVVLGELARERQIFVFTCHEAMARELEERGARLIRLDDPE